jgi:eukaryotic-like serine/threonine-protein kinase
VSSDRGDESVGRVILGRYRVVLPLGRGGQGTVYLARGEGAEGFARPVVVKRILAPLARDPSVLEQFAREARITAQLRHPAIVPIIDFARDRDSHVMVLEYVHGYDLRRWERYVRRVRGHFPAELVVYPLLRVLDALHYAHTLRSADGSSRSVVHRDISPANVLIDVEGHVKLTDFGIARMGDEEITQDTSTLKIKGKLPYLAPEMFLGERASERTDLYACGVVLHELLGGKNEFFAGSAVESMARVTGHVPRRLDAIRSDLPGVLSDIVERSLAKDPTERFQSAQEFASVLRAAFDLNENEMAEHFRTVIFEDFNDPLLAQLTGSRTLSDLDSAWRDARNVASLAEHARLTEIEPAQGESGSSTVATVVDSGLQVLTTGPNLPQAPVPVASAERLRGLYFGSAVAAAVAVLALGALFLTRAEWGEAPRFVYVDTQPSSPASAPSAPSVIEIPDDALAARPVEAEPALTAAAPVAPRSEAPLGKAERLTKAFSKRRAEVERCFTQPGGTTQSSVLVQFSVDVRGRVRSASLVPDSLTRTAFGRCVTRIAEATNFGAQQEPIAFRIPITARATRDKP